MDNNKTFNEKDFEYTIVMDASYTGPDVNDVRTPPKGAEDPHAEEERLYADYERMAFKLPTVLDRDDAYPHSYQWRVAERYDPGKIAAIEEALNNKTTVEATSAYRKFVEEMKNRKFKPESWD